MKPKIGMPLLSQANSSQAFTLVELLVVTSILVVLVALLFPNLTRFVESANVAKCTSNQKAIVTAILQYAGENNGQLPHYGVIPEQGRFDKSKYWWNAVAPYLEQSPTDGALGYKIHRCPSADKEVSTTIGVHYAEKANKAPFAFKGGPYPGSMRLSRVSGSTVLIADIENPAGQYWFLSPNQFPLSVDSDDDGIKDSLPGTPSRNSFAPRHNHAAVCGFADGSVKLISLRDWGLNQNNLWGD